MFVAESHGCPIKMGPGKKSAINTSNHSEDVKRPCFKAHLIDTTFYITKLGYSVYYMYIFDPFIPSQKLQL